MKNKIVIIIGIIVVLVIAFSFLSKPSPQTSQEPTLTIGDKTITIEIARRPEEHTLGLSYRDSMPEDHGMLFVFNQPTTPAFWMYEMKFPLDMIWIKDNKIVYIHENVPPQDPNNPTDLLTYSPPEIVDSILEVNGGWVKRNEIKIGDFVEEISN